MTIEEEALALLAIIIAARRDKDRETEKWASKELELRHLIKVRFMRPSLQGIQPRGQGAN